MLYYAHPVEVPYKTMSDLIVQSNRVETKVTFGTVRTNEPYSFVKKDTAETGFFKIAQ